MCERLSSRSEMLGFWPSDWFVRAEITAIVVALTYRATVDLPARFRNSKAVGTVFGLTPSKASCHGAASHSLASWPA